MFLNDSLLESTINPTIVEDSKLFGSFKDPAFEHVKPKKEVKTTNNPFEPFNPMKIILKMPATPAFAKKSMLLKLQSSALIESFVRDQSGVSPQNVIPDAYKILSAGWTSRLI